MIVAFKQRDGEGAVEAVASADGIDGLNAERLDPVGAAPATATKAPSPPRLRTTL